MATGVYGINRPADVSPEDVEIWLEYQANRDVPATNTLTKLDATQILVPANNPNNTNTAVTEIFGGLYTLKLPSTNFGAKGFYTVYIKPKEIRTRIVDCGVLSAFPDIKGLIFDTGEIDDEFRSKFENGGLTGYRIEYLNTNPQATQVKVQNFFRVITSNNKAEPVNQNLSNTNQKAIRYRFNDNSSLVFCTVSPSSSSNVKPNTLPYIGEPNQEVIITNTFFNPVMIEIEMVDHDIETLAYGIFGPQSKSLEDGIYTIYNFEEEIYRQYNLYEIKDQISGKPLFEIREPRTNIDNNKGFDDVTSTT